MLLSQENLWSISSLIFSLTVMFLKSQMFRGGSKDPHTDRRRNCYKKRKKQNCSVARNTHDGTLPIIEKVGRTRFPCSSGPMRRAISTIKNVFYFMFMMMNSEGPPEEPTCKICGKTICKVCGIFSTSTEPSMAWNAKDKHHHPSKSKKVRQPEPPASYRVNTEHRLSDQKTSVKSTHHSSLLLSYFQGSSFCRVQHKVRNTLIEYQDNSGPMRGTFWSHTKKVSRGRIIPHSPGRTQTRILRGIRKTFQTDNLLFLVPGSKWCATIFHENSDTWCRSSSIRSSSIVLPSEERFGTDAPYNSVLSRHDTSEQLSCCPHEKDLQTGHSGLRISYSGRSATYSCLSSPSKKSGLETMWSVNSALASFLSSPSEDEVLSVVPSSASETLHSISTETLFVKDCHLERPIQGKSLKQEWRLPAMPNNLQGVFMLSNPPLKQPNMDQMPVIKVIRIVADTSFSSATIEFFELEACFLKSKVRERLDWHILNKNIYFKWGLPTLLQRSFQAIINLAADYPQAKTCTKINGDIVMTRGKAFLISKTTRKDLESLHEVLKWKPRVFTSTCMDANSAQSLKLKLNPKYLTRLWGCPNRHPLSYGNSIPKHVLLAVRLQSSGKSIEFLSMADPFLNPRVRESLEWHVKKRSFHHKWGMPGFLQNFLQTFISSVANSTQTTGHSKATIKLIIIREVVSFMNEDTRTHPKQHMKDRIMQDAFGLPQEIPEALWLFHHAPPPCYDRVFLTEEENTSGLSFSSSVKIMKTLRPSEAIEVLVQSALDQPQLIDKTIPQKHTGKQCVEMHMEIALSPMKRFMKAVYFPVNQTLAESDQPGCISIQSGNRFLPFLEPNSLHSRERHIHDQMSLWVMPTLQKELLSRMSLRLFPLSKTITGRGAATAISEMGMYSLKPDLRKPIGWYVERNTLYQPQSLTSPVQKSLQAFILAAPELKTPRMEVNSRLDILIVTGDLFSMNECLQQNLEKLAKKKVVHQKIGLTQHIMESVIVCRPPTSEALIHCDDFDPIPGCTSPSVQVDERYKETLGDARESIKHVCHCSENADFCKSMIFLHKYMDLNIHPIRWYLESILGTSHSSVNKSLTVDGSTLNPSTPEPAPMGERFLETRRLIAFVQQEIIDCIQKNIRHKFLKVNLEVWFSHMKDFGKLLYIDPLKMIPSGPISNVPKPTSLPFIQHNAIQGINLNVVHKHLLLLWELPTVYPKSLKNMIPKATFWTIPIRSKEAVIELLDLQTHFLASEKMNSRELHFLGKKLQHEWKLLAVIQRSFIAFDPMHPKATAGRLKPNTEMIVHSVGLRFVDTDTKRQLEISLRSTRVHHTFCLPKKIQTALNIVKSPSTMTPHLPSTSRDGESMFALSRKRNTHVPNYWVTRKHAKDVHSEAHHLGKCLITSLFPKAILKHKLQFHLARKNIELKLGAVASLVKNSHEEAFLEQNIPLPKTICVGEKSIQERIRGFPFMEPAAVSGMDLNLERKKVAFLLDILSKHTQLLSTIVHKPSSLAARIRSDGAVIDFSEMETPFIEWKLRTHLEWHVKNKRLRRECRLSPYVQASRQAFISSTRALVDPTNHKEPDLENLPLASKLLFMDEETQERLNFHIRKLIVQKRFGLCQQIQDSLRRATPCTPHTLEQAPHEDTKPSECAFLGVSKTLQDTKGSVGFQETLKPLKSALTATGYRRNKKLEQHITKKCLEVKMSALPFVVMRSLRAAFPTENTYLPKQISMGLRSPYTDSLNSIPTASSLLPQCQAKRVSIEFAEKETPFIESKLRMHLEWHVKHKRLLQECRLPPGVQASRQAFIPSTREIFGPRTHTQPDFKVVPLASKLLFMDEETQERLDFHIRKLIVQKRFGLSQQIQDSLRRATLCTPPTLEQAPDEDRKPSETALLRVSKTLQSTKGSRGPQETLKARQSALAAKYPCNKKLEQHIAKKCLEVKMSLLPFVVAESLRKAFVTEKTYLPKSITLMPNFRKRTTAVSCLERNTVHQVDMNIKKKQLMSILGLTSSYTESLMTLMPTASFLLSQFQAKRFSIEFSEKKTPFLGRKLRLHLECHVMHKRLLQECGFHREVQESLQAFIPFARELFIPRIDIEPELEESASEPKKVRQHNLSCIIDIDSENTTQSNSSASSLWKMITLLQKVMSFFMERVSKLWAQVEETPATSGVEGLASALESVLVIGEASTPDMLEEDEVPRRTPKTLKANTEKNRTADMSCQTLESVQPCRTIAAHLLMEENTSNDQDRRNERSSMYMNVLVQNLTAPPQNRDRKGTREVRTSHLLEINWTKPKWVPTITADKEVRDYNRHTAQQVISMSVVTVEKETSAPGSVKVTGQGYEVEGNSYVMLCYKEI